MRLVQIYGPPAAGKFTIGSEVAKLTGFRLFHNHLSIAAIEPVFTFGSDTFWRLVDGMRDNVIAAAAEDDVSLIFTQVYEHPDDLAMAQHRFELVESRGGEVCLVRLTCAPDVLESRLNSASRAAMQKLTDVEVLRASFRDRDVRSAIPGRPSLLIDTATMTPAVAAGCIIRHYNLTGDAPA